jgi:hypothetical protein
MNYFSLMGLVILIFGLIQDYKRDKGQNTRAKVFHVVCLTILIASYAGSFRVLGMLTRNFDKAQERFSVDVGLVPGQIHFIFYLLHSVLAMTVIIIAYQMIRRNDKSRKLLITLLPFLALLEIFSFYRGWIIDGDDLGVNHGIILLIGFLLIGGLTSVIVAVYKSKFMTTFFTMTEQNQLLTNRDKSDYQPN